MVGLNWGGAMGSKVENSRIDLKLAYFQQTLLYSPPLSSIQTSLKVIQNVI